MPTSEQILNGLSAIANQWQLLASAWRIYFAVLVGSLALDMRPSKQIGAFLLAVPLLSVSLLAWLSANLFDGFLFALVSVALLIIALSLPQEPIEIAPLWLTAAGIFLFLFGCLYPSYLESGLLLAYFYAAPVGLIPCPTLSIITGLSLIVGGLESRAWSGVLGGMSLFYALFGAIRLGVTIDLILFVGALLLLLIGFLPKIGASKQLFAH